MFDEFILQLKLTYRLMVDNRVSVYTKSIPVFILIYIISPIDLIPFIPIDDIAILLAGLKLFEELIPSYIVTEHRADLGMKITSGSE
ncbi:MAG: hypothetical protein AAFV33_25340 [Chloroflexota bacterium]